MSGLLPNRPNASSGSPKNSKNQANPGVYARGWMRYPAYRRQHLPGGSGITEAAGPVVCTQRPKHSDMSWTMAGGQIILDLRVIWCSGVWDDG
jgi:hypothetical protein